MEKVKQILVQPYDQWCKNIEITMKGICVDIGNDIWYNVKWLKVDHESVYRVW